LTHSEVAHEGGPGGRALHLHPCRLLKKCPQLALRAFRTESTYSWAGHLGVTHVDIPITPEKVWQIPKKKGVAE